MDTVIRFMWHTIWMRAVCRLEVCRVMLHGHTKVYQLYAFVFVFHGRMQTIRNRETTTTTTTIECSHFHLLTANSPKN